MNRLLHAASAAAAMLAVQATTAGLLHAQVSVDQAIHIANRLTFGQTEDLVNQIQGATSTPALNWINSQLAPNFTNENPDVAALLAAVRVPAAPINPGDLHTFDEIRKGVLVYSAFSNWQLAARMGYFWDRHFNTFALGISAYLDAVPAYGLSEDEARSVTARLEWSDYEYYRQNGLGLFRDLVRRTFFSPAMLIYLDSVVSQCSGSSSAAVIENHHREFLELETVGPVYLPNGQVNYTTSAPPGLLSDLQVGARVFAGWRLQGNGYGPPAGTEFSVAHNVALACPVNATMFGSGGIQPLVISGPLGTPMLDALINHVCQSDACKDFICRKLMTEFLGDGSPAAFPTVLTAMTAQWGQFGNLSAVLGALFTHPQFLAAATSWSRAKTPLEAVVSHVRIWGGTLRSPINNALEAGRLDYLNGQVDSLREALFAYPAPDGFPLESNQQPSAATMLQAMKMFQDSYYAKSLPPVGAPPTTPPYARGINFPIARWVTLRLGAANTNAQQIATLFLNRAYGSKWTPTDLLAVGRALTRDVNGVVAPLNPANANDYAARLGQGVMATMSLNQAFLR